MFSLLAGWIPIIGPIIQGIVSIWTGKQQETVQLRQADVEDNRTAASIIAATDSLGLRLARDMYCAPAIVHLWLTSWDTFVSQNHHSWMLHIAAYPPSYSWYTYSVAAFLVGSIGLNFWKNK